MVSCRPVRSMLARRDVRSWIPELVAWCVLIAAILVVELGVRAPAAGSVPLPAPGWLRAPVEVLRATPAVAIGDARASAVVSGVTFGRTEHVSPADQDAFLSSGLWHLLAASGQNIALVATCSVLVVRWLGGSRVTGTLLAMLAIPMYVLVVGGGASIVRAGIMGELGLVVWFAGRLADTRRLLVIAAAIICWTWPGAHRGLGMQLSFACVAALGTWAVPVTRWLERAGVPTWLATGCAATAVCSFATAPLLVLRTDAAPLTGVVSNLLAVPLAGAILVVGLAGSLLSVCGLAAVGHPVLQGAGLLARVLLDLAERGAQLPAAQTSSRAIAVALPAIVLGWWLISRALPAKVSPSLRRRLRLVAVGTVALTAMAAFGAAAGPAPLRRVLPGGSAARAGVPTGDFRLAVLDIGQGDAALLATPDAAVLFDVGPPDGRVVRRVRELGVDRVDGIVLSHDSLDHRGGFDEAVAALHPRWVATALHAAGDWRHVQSVAPKLLRLCAGDRITVGAARVDVLHPSCDGHVVPRTSDLHNDGAMVILISYGRTRMLVPADAEAPVLVHLPIPPLDVLRISHHGSSDPYLLQLLEQVRPGAAAISVGEGNDYGHPRRDTLRALGQAGVPVRRTDEDGTIVFDSDGRNVVERR